MDHVHTAIIGAGFGGIGAAIQMRRAGFDDFVVLERAAEIGGTWRDNTYPGCACDVQSHLYSYSFAPNPGWSRSFSGQQEIWDYLVRCARVHGVEPHLRAGHEVRDAAWDGDARHWRIRTSRGDVTASFLVMATGGLSDPKLPELPGLEDFRGAVFHSARWDHSVELRGRRVAVVGTGASAVQFIPEIQPRVASLQVYQRTAPWVVPRRDRAFTAAERRIFAALPAAQRLARGAIYLAREAMLPLFRRPALARRMHALALRHLERSVPDPVLREKLTPRFTIGCKRVLISSDYLPALTRGNVELVTGPIARVRPHGIVTADGVEREAEVIIFGTGFRPTDPPLARHVRGREGHTLAEHWGGSPRAHLGTMVAGFPNLMLLMGPNTGLGHTSVLIMLEAQISQLVEVLRHMRDRAVAALEPTPEAQAAFVDEVDRRTQGTVWTAGGCSSWYLDSTGRNSTLWPDSTWRYRRMARLRPEEFVMVPR